MSFADENFELREIQKLEGHTDRVWSLAWKPATGSDGVPAVLSSCSEDKTVRIWEQSPATDSFQCKAVLEETHTRTVRSCMWSPSGKLLATASFDGTTAIWEDTGGDFECVSTLEGHENEVKSVSWNTSGSLLATCGRDKSVWIWEVLPHNEFDCVAVLQGHTQDVKMVLLFSFENWRIFDLGGFKEKEGFFVYLNLLSSFFLISKTQSKCNYLQEQNVCYA